MNSIPFIATVSNASEDKVLIFGRSFTNAAIMLENAGFSVLKMIQLTDRGFENEKALGVKLSHDVQPYKSA